MLTDDVDLMPNCIQAVCPADCVDGISPGEKNDLHLRSTFRLDSVAHPCSQISWKEPSEHFMATDFIEITIRPRFPQQTTPIYQRIRLMIGNIEPRTKEADFERRKIYNSLCFFENTSNSMLLSMDDAKPSNRRSSR